MSALILAIKCAFAILLLVVLKAWRPVRAWREASEWFPWVFAAGYLANRVFRDPSADRVSHVVIESLLWLLLFVTLLYAIRGEAEALPTRPRWQMAATAALCGAGLLAMIL